MIFAHGAHKMRPMELYKEKPVFYSTGNFMLDLRHLVKHPYGDLLHFGCKSMEEYIDFLCSAFDDDSWDSVLPYCHYQNGRFDKIQLYPISLAHDMADTQNYGMPELADGKRAVEILEKFSNISKDYHVNIKIERSGNTYAGILV